MASYNTKCPFCDEVVRAEASVQEIRTMDTFAAASRLAVVWDQHLDDHVEGIIKALENVRG
jgi:hypothetical protein